MAFSSSSHFASGNGFPFAFPLDNPSSFYVSSESAYLDCSSLTYTYSNTAANLDGTNYNQYAGYGALNAQYDNLASSGLANGHESYGGQYAHPAPVQPACASAAPAHVSPSDPMLDFGDKDLSANFTVFCEREALGLNKRTNFHHTQEVQQPTPHVYVGGHPRQSQHGDFGQPTLPSHPTQLLHLARAGQYPQDHDSVYQSSHHLSSVPAVCAVQGQQHQQLYQFALPVTASYLALPIHAQPVDPLARARPSSSSSVPVPKINKRKAADAFKTPARGQQTQKPEPTNKAKRSKSSAVLSESTSKYTPTGRATASGDVIDVDALDESPSGPSSSGSSPPSSSSSGSTRRSNSARSSAKPATVKRRTVPDILQQFEYQRLCCSSLAQQSRDVHWRDVNIQFWNRSKQPDGPIVNLGEYYDTRPAGNKLQAEVARTAMAFGWDVPASALEYVKRVGPGGRQAQSEEQKALNKIANNERAMKKRRADAAVVKVAKAAAKQAAIATAMATMQAARSPSVL